MDGVWCLWMGTFRPLLQPQINHSSCDLQVLFVHTGGLLGTYDKCEQLQPLIESLDKSHRMRVTG